MSEIEKSLTNRLGRKIIVTGHYGSGKTEFSVSLAMQLGCLRNRSDSSYDIAIIDLDIVNPYFRSRERRDLLESSGIAVYGSLFDKEITAELPALGASLRAPLENSSCRVIIDVGGNEIGALVLKQFSKYFTDDTTMLVVVNANRPDTGDLSGVLEHITAIEKSSGLTVSGLVNNTHLLRETTASDIKRGQTLCKEVSGKTGKHLICDCYPVGVVDPHELAGISENLMPLGLYMRPTWLDK